MTPDIQAVIREIERQRDDLMSGLGIAAAYEKACSRAANAVFAAEQAKAQAAAAEARAEAAEKRVAELLAGSGEPSPVFSTADVENTGGMDAVTQGD